MLLCKIRNYLIKRQSESYIIMKNIKTKYYTRKWATNFLYAETPPHGNVE